MTHHDACGQLEVKVRGSPDESLSQATLQGTPGKDGEDTGGGRAGADADVLIGDQIGRRTAVAVRRPKFGRWPEVRRQEQHRIRRELS